MANKKGLKRWFVLRPAPPIVDASITQLSAAVLLEPTGTHVTQLTGAVLLEPTT